MGWRDQIEVVPATVELALEIAPRLRAEDVEEIRAATGERPLAHLVRSIVQSSEAWVFQFGGEPAVIAGIIEVGRRVGSLWCLTTEAVARHKKAFVHCCREELARALRRWDSLGELVDARYTGALRLLERLGAELGPRVKLGPESRPFHPFVLRAAHVG